MSLLSVTRLTIERQRAVIAEKRRRKKAAAPDPARKWHRPDRGPAARRSSRTAAACDLRPVTVQVSDSVLVDDTGYLLAGAHGNSLFDPRSLGVEPTAFSSDCWRGFYCTYAVADGALVLRHLTVGLREADRLRASERTLPGLVGVAPTRCDGAEFTYEGLSLPVAFRGTLLLCARYDGLDNYRWFHPIWSHADVREPFFEAGRLTRSRNLSAPVREMRADHERRRLLHPDTDWNNVRLWPAHPFSVDYDCLFPPRDTPYRERRAARRPSADPAVMVGLDELAAALAPHGLAHEAAALRPYAHFEVALVWTSTATTTHIGGDPELPPGFEWPRQRWPREEVAAWPDEFRAEVEVAREADGSLALPLTFLLQVDLAAVQACAPTTALPATGRLLFFALPDFSLPDPVLAERVPSAVRFVEGPALATVAPPPTEWQLWAMDRLRPTRRLRLALSAEEEAALLARLATDAQRAFVLEAAWQDHALLVAPAEENARPMPPPGEVALARVVEQHGVGFHVGDASWLTFVIPAADLAARRWEAARASVFVG